MGCRQSKEQYSLVELHHFNMLVVGYQSSGKTKLLAAIKGSHNSQKNTLEINTINLGKIKLMIFEVSGKAQMTWKNFYPITDLLMFVLDPTDDPTLSKAKFKLHEIDSTIKQTAKIFVALTKSDKLCYGNDNQTKKGNSEAQMHNQALMQDEKAKDIVKKLDLGKLRHESEWQQCSAQTGQGVKELVTKLQNFLLKTNKV